MMFTALFKCIWCSITPHSYHSIWNYQHEQNHWKLSGTTSNISSPLLGNSKCLWIAAPGVVFEVRLCGQYLNQSKIKFPSAFMRIKWLLLRWQKLFTWQGRLINIQVCRHWLYNSLKKSFDCPHNKQDLSHKAKLKVCPTQLWGMAQLWGQR